jgi:hypothetical protein
VDIFAPRHSPVLAPTDGTITRVEESELGGNHVWLHDTKRSMHLYFAHLQTQEVVARSLVKQGDTLGTVGNTGNAKYTPPHLHFGIYSRGPIDPFYFIAETDTIPAQIKGDRSWLGEWGRTSRSTLLYPSPSARSEITDTLDSHSPLQVLALSDKYCRVLLADGTLGYVKSGNLELLHDEISLLNLAASAELLETPNTNSLLKTKMRSGETFAVMGTFEGFLFGKTPRGDFGWISAP